MAICWNRTKQITAAFESAPEVVFDDTSKIVFVSDCHRGDGSSADVFYPYRNIYTAALKYYGEGGFTFVELGDSDELWENRKFSEIRETYSKIFEYLSQLYKEGRYLTVVGNHDMVKKKPKWVLENMRNGEGGQSVELFPGLIFPMGLVFRHEKQGWKIYVLHGHQADCINSDFWLLSRFLVRYLWRPLASIGVKNPMRASNSKKKKRYITDELISWVQRENAVLIAGHTHLAAFPEPGGGQYFNDGSCVNREEMSSIELVDGAISLVKWGIESNDDGLLHVQRTVDRGPEPLELYFAKESSLE